MSNDILTLIAMFLFRIIGIIEWALLFFLLMEVVICKDVRHGDIHRILNSPVNVRWRMFKKSWQSLFYKGTLLIFFAALFAIVSMISDMWLGHMPRAPYTWTLVSVFLPIGIFMIYYSRGYRITFLQKFHLFMLNKHE